MNAAEVINVRLLRGPSLNEAGCVELRVSGGGREIVVAIGLDRSVWVVDASSLAVENAVRVFVGRFRKAQCVLLHRVMVASRVGRAPSCGEVTASPTLDSKGRLCFRVSVNDREFEMRISPTLVPSSAGLAGAKELTEDLFSAVYDGCLLYMDGHLDELVQLGFETSEFKKQRALADSWSSRDE